MEANIESAKIAVVLRAARSAIGWNQQQFSEKMGVAKSTIARIETLDMAPRADFLLKALELFAKNGVRIDFSEEDKLLMTINESCYLNALADLIDPNNRRPDRRPPLSPNKPEAAR